VVTHDAELAGALRAGHFALEKGRLRRVEGG